MKTEREKLIDANRQTVEMASNIGKAWSSDIVAVRHQLHELLKKLERFPNGARVKIDDNGEFIVHWTLDETDEEVKSRIESTIPDDELSILAKWSEAYKILGY